MNLIELGRRFVAIDSTPTNGNSESADFVAEIGKELGFDVQIQTESIEGQTQCNVLLRPPNSSKENEILMVNRLETPDPGSYAQWTKTDLNPFKASLHDGVLFGLGTASSKMDLISKVLAAKKFLDKPLKRPFVIVGTFGTNTNLEGIKRLIRRKLVKADLALVGVPTEMKLMVAGGGVTAVEVSIPFSPEEIEYQIKHNSMEISSSQSKMFKGRSGLSLRPQLGDNAINKMLEYLENLPEGIAIMDMDGGTSPNTIPASAFLEIDPVSGFKDTIINKIVKLRKCLHEIESEFSKYPDEGFEAQLSSFNIGKIRKFRDQVRIHGCSRILPSVPPEKAEEWIHRIHSVCKEVGATFRVITNNRPFQLKEDSENVDAIKRALKNSDFESNMVKSSICTEANILNSFGIESVAIGPGKGMGNIHEPNERIAVSDLERSQMFYEALLNECCL